MAIIGTLPNNIQNGQAVDANPVMADLNFIVNQVNANAAPASTTVTTGSAPSFGSPLAVSGAVGTNRIVELQTSGSNRWVIEADSAAESGSTAGSNFQIISCTDGGATGTAAFTIIRATNLVSMTSNAVVAGTLTAGNVVISSDERLKKDWTPIADDFLERLANVKTGAFTKISTGERSVGVTAQSLREALPEAVVEGEGEGNYLSVAYGNAALVAVIELTKEVQRLRALLEPKE